MTNELFDRNRYSAILQAAEDEVITESKVRDVPLPGNRTLALITLDNNQGYKRPNTLGPNTLAQLGELLVTLAQRAGAGEIHAVAVTGKRFNFAAGADLSLVGQIPDTVAARQMAELGHDALGLFSKLGVPSFALVNGMALGGGLEVALHCDYRVLDSSCPAVAFPETYLGLVPGWGGATITPNLIGIENALRVIIENPLKMNRMLRAEQAYELGLFDRLINPVNFIEDSLKFITAVLDGEKVKRPNEPGKLERAVKWDAAIKIARKSLEQKIGEVPQAPYRALEILAAVKKGDREAGFELENQALGDLVASDQFMASMYGFNLVQKRAKRPVGAPDSALARPITRVGVIGAGLMASQFALLFARRLQVPVVMTDLDQERVDRGVASVQAEIDKLLDKNRINTDTHARLKGLVTGTTDRQQFADCDWVIEAVFEELSVKQQVFSEFEEIVPEDAIMATNTSSLSVAEIGEPLKHPERLIGFHFFNPVAVMPLVEVVKVNSTSDETLATAMAVAKQLKKNAVIVRDRPGFVVNRLLARMLGEVMHAVDTGTSAEVADTALEPMGLPMSPFTLLELIGLKVGAHVLRSHHEPFPDRFFDSASLHDLADRDAKLLKRDGKGNVTGYTRELLAVVGSQGNSPLTAEQLLERTQNALADEVKIMLDEQVVTAAEDLDLCLILGAGFPLINGGLTPYLDRIGASERVFGGTFHTPKILGAATREAAS